LPSDSRANANAPKNVVLFSTSIVTVPASGDVSPSYVQPSSVNVARTLLPPSPLQDASSMTAISVTMATAARTPSDMGRIYCVVMRVTTARDGGERSEFVKAPAVRGDPLV